MKSTNCFLWYFLPNPLKNEQDEAVTLKVLVFWVTGLKLDFVMGLCLQWRGALLIFL